VSTTNHAKGDDEAPVTLLRNGLERFSEAPPIDHARALLYLAELQMRAGDSRSAARSLAETTAIELSDRDLESVAPDIDHVREIVGSD
jgi:hypothetical protein